MIGSMGTIDCLFIFCLCPSQFVLATSICSGFVYLQYIFETILEGISKAR